MAAVDRKNQTLGKFSEKGPKAADPLGDGLSDGLSDSLAKPAGNATTGAPKSPTTSVGDLVSEAADAHSGLIGDG
jgi:hypothetical protein